MSADERLTTGDVEVQRRNLMRAYPELYAYVIAVEQARTFDGAGDLVSGASSGEGAANRLWTKAAAARKHMNVLLKHPPRSVNL